MSCRPQLGVGWLLAVLAAACTLEGKPLCAAIAKIEKAIDEAAGQLAEVRIGAGYGEAGIGYNRRRINPDGTVTMLWRNPTRIPTSPLDPRVAVLRIDAVDGRPLAILVNHA